MRRGTIKIGGGTLETGWLGPEPAETPTLVLLHEGLGSVALWRDVPERLSAATGMGVFAYSRFGYGNSDPTLLPRPVTYMHHEAQVVLPQVLLAAEIKRAVLIGHSDGGSIASIFAGGVKAEDLSAGGDEVERRSFDRPAGASNSLPVLLGLITIAAHFTVEDKNVASIRQIKTEYDTGALRHRLARYHRDVDATFRGWNDVWLDPRFRGFDITDLLRNIRVPVLGLQGSDDPYGTDEQLRILEAHARAPVTTQLIRAARHAPQLEAKDTTLAAIVSFIRTLPEDVAA